MHQKTHQTAVVIIPPKEIWASIQLIRQQHDTNYRRWMPHITLMYPFRPRAEFDLVAKSNLPITVTILDLLEAIPIFLSSSIAIHDLVRSSTPI